jgi:hypothetical protein
VPSKLAEPARNAEAARSPWSGELRAWLSNPLLVAVVAALLGSLLIPSLTRGWQNHQKALEVQTGLVGEMSQSVASAVANSRFLAAGLIARSTPGQGAQQQAWNQLYRGWTTSAASIGARLQAYLGPSVASDWQNFSYALTDYISLSAQTSAGSGREAQLTEIYRYRNQLAGVQLSRSQWQRLAGRPTGNEFQSAYATLGHGLLARQDQLVRQVLHTHVTGF